MDEKIMNITLRKTKAAPRSKRAKRAINEIREHVIRHMKAKEDNIWIDHRLNEAIWVNGIQRPPLCITVKAVKFEDGLVEVSLPEDATVEE
jgi:large subunit ribosomal protein L31e